ncbi:hypothetical protein RIF29_20883 [Crotalaria pallida]|uniref:Uncharacterized protein n=1 Tax=Crotalaria pallida TaxID=3830 RepID=A0AAN9I6Q7_CROPI
MMVVDGSDKETTLVLKVLELEKGDGVAHPLQPSLLTNSSISEKPHLPLLKLVPHLTHLSALSPSPNPTVEIELASPAATVRTSPYLRIYGCVAFVLRFNSTFSSVGISSKPPEAAVALFSYGVTSAAAVWIWLDTIICSFSTIHILAKENNGVVDMEDEKPAEVDKSDEMDEEGPKHHVQPQPDQAEPKVKDKETHPVQDEKDDLAMQKRHVNVVFIGHVGFYYSQIAEFVLKYAKGDICLEGGKRLPGF